MCYLAVFSAWEDVKLCWGATLAPNSKCFTLSSSTGETGWGVVIQFVEGTLKRSGLNLKSWVKKTWTESCMGSSNVAFFSGIKSENNFNLKARVLQRKSPLSPAQFAPGWLEFNQCVCVCVCFSWLLSASPGLDSCRLHSEGPLNLGGYSFFHICYKFTRGRAFKGSFMEPSAALWLLPISHTHLGTHTYQERTFTISFLLGLF